MEFFASHGLLNREVSKKLYDLSQCIFQITSSELLIFAILFILLAFGYCVTIFVFFEIEAGKVCDGLET